MGFQALLGAPSNPIRWHDRFPSCPDQLIALVLSRIGPTCYDVPDNKVFLDLEPTGCCKLIMLDEVPK